MIGRNRLAITALVAAALALGACARLDEGAAGNQGPDDSVSSTNPSPNSPAPEPTPQIVEPRDGLVDVRARPWDEVEVEDERTLLVLFYGGVEECYGVDRVEVEYDEDTVTVTLYEGRVPTAEVCIEIAVWKGVRVTLDEPLGDREIVDGAAS